MSKTAVIKTPKNKKAFTLVEAVVASALLVVALVPILKALTGSHIASSRIERQTRSLNFARNKIDQIYADSVYNYDQSYQLDSEEIEPGYLCSVDDIYQSDDLRQISVSVGYDKDDDSLLEQDEIEVTLDTLVARRI